MWLCATFCDWMLIKYILRPHISTSRTKINVSFTIMAPLYDANYGQWIAEQVIAVFSKPNCCSTPNSDHKNSTWFININWRVLYGFWEFIKECKTAAWMRPKIEKYACIKRKIELRNTISKWLNAQIYFPHFFDKRIYLLYFWNILKCINSNKRTKNIMTLRCYSWNLVNILEGPIFGSWKH